MQIWTYELKRKIILELRQYDQATIFSVVIYYKDGGELKHRSIVIIFDNLAHDTVTVHEYQ